MALCSGLVTNQGGRTSHAAVVARQMDKICIVGCRAILIDLKERLCIVDKNIIHEGDYITLDGNSGSVYGGKADVIVERPSEIIEEIERWKKISELDRILLKVQLSSLYHCLTFLFVIYV